MNNTNLSEINDFVQKAREGMLCDEDLLKMEGCLVSSIKARQLYDEAIDLRVGLEVKYRRDEWERKLGIRDDLAQGPRETINNKLGESEGSHENSAPICDLSDLHSNDIWGASPADNVSTSTQANSDGSLLGFFVNCFQNNGLFIAKCMIALVTLLPIILLFFVMNDATVQEWPVVGTIMRQTDETQWGGDAVSRTDSKIYLGQRLRIQEGVVELQMASGVRVLIDKNTSLFLTGPNDLYLERGSLVAQVGPESIGFTVRTPDADFIDLGTEFGVNVDPGKISQTKVLVGKVNVQVENKDGTKTQKQLNVNEAAQVIPGGKIESIAPNSLAFTSVYPDDRACLFNLICRDNAYFPDGIWIDPLNGELVLPTKGSRSFSKTITLEDGDNKFHPIPTLQMIDGIFVPVPNTQTIVNSEGGRFGGIKNESGSLRACFTIGKLFGTGNWNATEHDAKLLSQIAEAKSSLPDEDRTFMGIHANLGITLDLNAVRRQTGRKAIQFFSMAKKIEDDVRKAEPTVLDVIILADKKPIYEKRGVTLQEGEFPIRVDIPQNARFLSIITADGHDATDLIPAISCDYLIFDSPAFILESKTVKEKSAN